MENTVVQIPSSSSNELAALRESNHRIANHLLLLAGMIQVQARSLKAGPDLLTREAVHGMLRETAGKVVSIGHLHRRMAEQPHTQRIELGNYLIECCAELISSLALEGKVSIAQRIANDCNVKADCAQRIALFVNEVIMNSVKHAHPTGIPTEMELVCRRAGNDVVIDICDDGVGLPEGFDAGKDGGVGFNLIRTLCGAMGGKLEVNSDSLGTSFRLEVPMEDAVESNVTPIFAATAD